MEDLAVDVKLLEAGLEPDGFIKKKLIEWGVIEKKDRLLEIAEKEAAEAEEQK